MDASKQQDEHERDIPLRQGRRDREDGRPVSRNPYSRTRYAAAWMAWREGWRAADDVCNELARRL